MAYMRTSIAFALFWVNLIVASLNIYFSVSVGKYLSPFSSSSSSSSSSSTQPYYNPSSSSRVSPYVPSYSPSYKPTTNPSTYNPYNPYNPGTYKPTTPTYKPYTPTYKPTIPTFKPKIPSFKPTIKFPGFKFRFIQSPDSETNDKILENNVNYFHEKENDTPKELRKLSNQDTRNVLLYVNLGSFLFILMLMMSFYTTKNECCCNEDEDDRNALCAAGCCCACCECCYECSFTFSGIFFLRGTSDPRLKINLIFLIIILFVFLVIYAPIKACGKHVTRIVSLIGLFLLNLALAILSFISGSDKFCFLMGVLSLVTAFLNFLGLILPSCDSCEKLSYDYLYSGDQITKEDSNPQQLLILPQQNMNSNEEEIYNKPEEEVPNQVNQYDTPNYTNTNPGYDNGYDNNIRDSINAPAPIYQVPDNDYRSNQVENDIPISYPKPE